MGRGKQSVLLYGKTRIQRQKSRAPRLGSWIRANLSEYLRILGTRHYALLREELHSRLVDEQVELHGADRFRIKLHDLTLKRDRDGDATLGCFYEVHVRRTDGTETCPAGVQEVLFDHAELFSDEWRHLVDPEIERRLNIGR